MRLRIVAPVALAEALKAIARGDSATISLFDVHAGVFGDPTHGGKLHKETRTDKTGRTQARYVAEPEPPAGAPEPPPREAAPSIPPALAEFLDDMEDGSRVAGPTGLVFYKRGNHLERKDGTHATAAELQALVDAMQAPEPAGHRPDLSTTTATPSATPATAPTTATDEPFDAARHVRLTVGDPREIRRHRVDELFEDVSEAEVPALRAYLHTYRADLDDDVDQAIGDRWPDLAETTRTTTATAPNLATPHVAPAPRATPTTTATAADPAAAAQAAPASPATTATEAKRSGMDAVRALPRFPDFTPGDVVTLKGGRRRYIVAGRTTYGTPVASFNLRALSGSDAGSGPSSVKAADLALDADQDVRFTGRDAYKRQRDAANGVAVTADHHREHAVALHAALKAAPVDLAEPKPAPTRAEAQAAAVRRSDEARKERERQEATVQAARDSAEKRRARSIGDPANNAKKLREAAASALSTAQEQIGRDRLVNTARRARMAGNIVAENAHKEALAKTAHTIADHIESGNAEHLLGVRAFAHIETLDAAARNAKRRVLQQEARAKGHAHTYGYEQDHSGRPFHPDHAEMAEFPHPPVHRSDLRRLLEYVKGRANTKEAAAYFARAADFTPLHDQNPVEHVRTAEGRHHLDTLLDAAEAKGLYGGKGYHAQGPRHGQPGYAEHEAKQNATSAVANIKDRMKDAKRLEAMGIHDEPTLQAALREYATMRADARKADPIKEAQKELIGRKFAGYFPTPPPVQRRVMQLADVRPGQRVLEPSAGTGHLADAVRAAGGNVTALEMQPALRKILELKGHTVAGNDALAHDGTYDRIVMNPPFEQGADMQHIQHAFEHNLKPGGRLVAILSEGPFFRSDRKAQAFRDFLAEHGAHDEKLPAGSFTQGDVPTGVNTRIVVLDKPDEVHKAVRYRVRWAA